MTTPISSSTAPGVAFVAAGLAPAAAGEARRAASTTGPAVVVEPCPAGAAGQSAALGAVGDVALVIEQLQARKTDAQAACERTRARTSRDAQLAAVQQRLQELSRAAAEQAKAEKSSFWSKVFKWVAVVVAALAAAVSAVFSAGTGAVVAGVVIAALLATEQVVKAVTDALVECSAMSEKAASAVNAAFGSIEEVVDQLADAGAFGEHGDKVAAVLRLAIGAAKAVVSCVVGGFNGVADIVGAACSLTAEAVRVAQEVVVLVAEAAGKEQKLSKELMLALSLINLCLDVAGAACSLADGARGDQATTRSLDERQRARISTLASSALTAAASGAKIGEASFGAAASIDRAASQESKDLAQRDEARIDAATASLDAARRALEQVFEELRSVRDDVDALTELRDRTADALLAPARA
jgi:hypothetical protein